jgi:hypothetical protein
MAEKKRSIIEEALWEAKSVEDALKANTKEILATTMKQEIDKVVKESLEEQEEVEDTEEVEGLENDDEGMEELPMGDEPSDEADDEVGGEEGELELDLDLPAGELGDEEGGEVLDLDMSDEEGGEELELDLDEPLDLGDEEGMGMDIDLDGELPDELDLTKVKNDDLIIKVFKKMGDDDEIEVVKDPSGGINISDNQTCAEYYIKESEEMEEGDQFCEGCGTKYESEEEVEEEVVYEIEMDEDMYEMYMDETEGNHGSELEEEETLEEDKTLQRRHGQRKHGAKVGMKT